MFHDFDLETLPKRVAKLVKEATNASQNQLMVFFLGFTDAQCILVNALDVQERKRGNATVYLNVKK